MNKKLYRTKKHSIAKVAAKVKTEARRKEFLGSIKIRSIADPEILLQKIVDVGGKLCPVCGNDLNATDFAELEIQGFESPNFVIFAHNSHFFDGKTGEKTEAFEANLKTIHIELIKREAAKAHIRLPEFEGETDGSLELIQQQEKIEEQTEFAEKHGE